jgi:hypothetical protein
VSYVPYVTPCLHYPISAPYIYSFPFLFYLFFFFISRMGW